MKVGILMSLILVPLSSAINITEYRSGLPICGVWVIPPLWTVKLTLMQIDCLSACIPQDTNAPVDVTCLCLDTSISDNSNFCVNENCTRLESWGEFFLILFGTCQ